MMPSSLITTLPPVGCKKPSVVTDPGSKVHKKPASLLNTSIITGISGSVTALSSLASIKKSRQRGSIR